MQHIQILCCQAENLDTRNSQRLWSRSQTTYIRQTVLVDASQTENDLCIARYTFKVPCTAHLSLVVCWTLWRTVSHSQSLSTCIATFCTRNNHSQTAVDVRKTKSFQHSKVNLILYSRLGNFSLWRSSFLFRFIRSWPDLYRCSYCRWGKRIHRQLLMTVEMRRVKYLAACSGSSVCIVNHVFFVGCLVHIPPRFLCHLPSLVYVFLSQEVHYSLRLI